MPSSALESIDDSQSRPKPFPSLESVQKVLKQLEPDTTRMQVPVRKERAKIAYERIEVTPSSVLGAESAAVRYRFQRLMEGLGLIKNGQMSRDEHVGERLERYSDPNAPDKETLEPGDLDGLSQ